MSQNLPPILEKFSGQRVLVLGDLMLDRFVYGRVERISPEAPIPVLRIDRELMMPGGAGNVVRNLAALGAQVDVIGIAGKDQASYDLAEQFATLHGVTPTILTDPSRPTTLKIRCIAGSQQLLRADREDGKSVSPELEEQIMLHVTAALPGASIVILSDYAKGVLTETMVPRVIELAQKQGKRVVIDPKGRDFSRYRGAFMITPNRKELTEATGVSAIKTVAQAEQAARVLITAYNIECVLAKLGGDGVCLVTKDQPAVHIHGTAREVFDVSGAGDTVVAAMAMAMAAGAPLPDAAYLANLAGSIVVGKVGTATVTVDDLLSEMQEDNGMSRDSIHNKLMSLPEACAQAEKWRMQGLKVGFTNGCFDLLHPGHLASIRQARARCDRLIVGLNADSSVKKLKGEHRPVQNEQMRAAVLSALSDVDMIVIFAEDTPYELIKALRPTVMVKGSDYRPEQVVGWDLVQGWGGELHLVDLVAGHSTTSTIDRMSKTASG
ncbi:MAG: D-glycero-beta-D-manno-heptose-7-phosphate kinase [Alphaproteobacteria bacterium]